MTPEFYWRSRLCFICGTAGPCAHREFEVAYAECERADRQLERARELRRKPPGVETAPTPKPKEEAL